MRIAEGDRSHSVLNYCFYFVKAVEQAGGLSVHWGKGLLCSATGMR